MRGVACEHVHSVTGAMRPATYFIDRSLQQLKVTHEGGMDDAIVKLADIEDVCTTSDDTDGNAKGSRGVPSVARVALSPGRLTRLVVLYPGTLCLLCESQEERDEFQIALQILRFVPGELAPTRGAAPPPSNFGPSAGSGRPGGERVIL